MSTPWLFDYTKLTTPEKFNIRPYYSISSLRMDDATNIIYDFDYDDLQYLEVNMLITLDGTNSTAFGTTRSIDSIDYLYKTVTFSGEAVGFTESNATFNFQANPGYLSEVSGSLTGQQVHDNFFNLGQGLTNHQERLSLIEGYDLASSSPEVGYIKYNGFEKTTASFYGGSPLVLTAGTVYDIETIIDSTNPLSFSMAMNNSVEAIPSESQFSVIDVSKNLALGYTTTLQGICDEINLALKNNKENFQFLSEISLASYTIGSPYDISDWDEEATFAGFDIRLDDSDTLVTITFSEDDRPTNLSSLILFLNGKFETAGIATKIVAEQVDLGGGDLRLGLTADSTRTGTPAGVTKVELINLSSGSFLETVLYINEGIIFDYSTTITFQPDATDTKVSIVGLDPAFKMVLKDDVTYPALNGVGFGVNQYNGSFTTYHSASPSSDVYSLNFDGKLSATSILATNGAITNLEYTSLLGESLYSELGQFKSIELSNTVFPLVDPLNTPFVVLPAGYDTINYNFMNTGVGAYLSALDVSGAVNIEGAVLIEGATSLTGTIDFANNLTVSNILHESTDRTFYLTSYFDTSGVPIADSFYDYLAYNGNLGAVDIAVGQNLKFNVQSVASSISGAMYSGDFTPTGTDFLVYNGNFKAVTLTGTSSRETKTNIIESSLDALDVLMNTLIVDYNFKDDLDTPRIGFIAEDTNSLLSGKDKKGIDITNCIGVIMKSIQQLHEMIKG